MTAPLCPLVRETCLEDACAWWDAALAQCCVVAVSDLMHSMYGGERADH